MLEKNKRSKVNGFTLIELLIVMIILGLLASLVGPAMFGKVDSSRVKTAQAQMQMFSTALDTYRLDIGSYPKSLEELRQSSHANWDGPYLPKNIPLDPWGNNYQFKAPGDDNQPYTLFSFGKDGTIGGEDDNADIKYF
jgi:general secretion pathway protein G